MAEANVNAQIPDYDTLGGDTKTYLESAVVCECCVLCVLLCSQTSYKNRDGYALRLYVDWENVDHYMSERDSYIGKVLSATSPIPYLTFG